MIHGDDCDAHRRRSFNVVTLSSAVCQGSPFDTKILMYAVDNSKSTTECFVLDTWLVWSLIECQEGQRMSVDPWQNALEGRSGPVCGPYRGVLVNLKGDEKWLQKALKLKQSWVSSNICPMCRASSKSGNMMYTQFGPHSPHRSTMLNTVQFISEAVNPGPWIRLPGFHVNLVTFDWLHIIDLAIIPECAASVTRQFYLAWVV